MRKIPFTPEMDRIIYAALTEPSPPPWKIIAYRVGVCQKLVIRRCRELNIKKRNERIGKYPDEFSQNMLSAIDKWLNQSIEINL